MKNTLSITFIVLTIGVLSLPLVWSDNDFKWGEIGKYWQQSNALVVPASPLYKEECGSCHMAYPAGLLPARSWHKIMTGLDDHFGDNAELDNETLNNIKQYLVDNSADHSDYRRARKFAASIRNGETPIRISNIPYFKHEHNGIPSRMVIGNKKLGSFSQCNACHLKAEQGSYNEHDVSIPGYGRWDD